MILQLSYQIDITCTTVYMFIWSKESWTLEEKLVHTCLEKMCSISIEESHVELAFIDEVGMLTYGTNQE